MMRDLESLDRVVEEEIENFLSRFQLMEGSKVYWTKFKECQSSLDLWGQIVAMPPETKEFSKSAWFYCNLSLPAFGPKVGVYTKGMFFDIGKKIPGVENGCEITSDLVRLNAKEGLRWMGEALKAHDFPYYFFGDKECYMSRKDMHSPEVSAMIQAVSRPVYQV